MSPIEEYEMEESREALLQTDEDNSENLVEGQSTFFGRMFGN